jgi:hypothetical protein
MRVVSRLVCAASAAALAVVAFIAAVEIVLAGFSRGPWLIDTGSWFDTITSETWSSSGLRLLAAIVALGGLVLLVVALLPRRRLTVPAHLAPLDGVDVAIRRREVEDLITSRLRSVPYVTGAEAAVTGDRIGVVAHATRRDGATEAAVRESVAETADQVALGDVERRVRVQPGSRRVA